MLVRPLDVMILRLTSLLERTGGIYCTVIVDIGFRCQFGRSVGLEVGFVALKIVATMDAGGPTRRSVIQCAVDGNMPGLREPIGAAENWIRGRR